jgi:hypothetical protein
MEIISRSNPPEAFHVVVYFPHLVVLPYESKYGERDVQVRQQCAIFRGEEFIIIQGVLRGNGEVMLVVALCKLLLGCEAAVGRVRGCRLAIGSTDH